MVKKESAMVRFARTRLCLALLSPLLFVLSSSEAGAFTISGTVTLNGTGLAGVVLTGLPGDPVTDASGHYSVTISFPELTGTVIPMRDGYGFHPHSTYYESVSSDTVTNYEAYPAGFRLDLYTFPNEPRWITNVIPIDFNHDGFLDIVATGQVTNQGTSPVPAFAYVNDGTGRFTEVSSQVLGGFKTWGLSFWAVRDFDGDGYDDLFIANVGMDEPPWTGGGHFLLMGSAEGTLIDEGAARVPGPREVASWGDAGDIDGDGDIDILTCGTGGMYNLLINDGTGHFNYDDFRMPPPAIEPPGFRSTNGQLLDVDHDGDLDIFFGLPIAYGIRDVLLINDGSGHFKRAPEASIPVRRFAGNGYNTGISTKGDLNGDGHPDILVALINHTTPSLQYNQLLLNRGDGTFEDASSRLWQDGAGGLGWNSHQIADFNGDGWADLLMLVIGSLLHINRGGLFFEDVHDSVTPGAPDRWHGYSAAVDVNNDGSMDIISSFPELFQLAVYVNILPYGIPEPPLPKPEAPYLISPANGEALSTIEASLRWSTVTGACGYRLQVAGNLDFGQIVLDRSDLTSGAFQLRGLQGNQTYFWRVRAINTRGEGPWSDGRFFTTPDTRMVSGDVTYQGNPLPGVRMMELPGQPVTDAAGHYETRVEVGWSGTARPYKANYNFVPETFTYSNVVTDRETDYIAYIGIPQHERRALIAFYQSTGGDSWTNKTGWKEPPLEADGFATYGSEGNWFGVTVDIMHPPQMLPVTIAELVLTNNNLQGMLPAELGALSNLRRLEVNGAIGGPLPASMAGLKKLYRLAINDTDLQGSIPAWLGNNLDLMTLELARNRLSGTIPPELGNCVNLQRLYIQKNAILGPIPPEIMNLSLLNEGSIDENALFANDPAVENFIKSHLGQMGAQTLAPTNLAAEAKSPSSIELRWSPGSYLSGYRIHYSTSKGGPYVLYGTAGDWESSRLITGLESGRTYYFVMQSYADPNPGQGQKNLVVSAFSAEVWAVTPGLTPKADDIVADFGTAGLWLWSAGVWTSITGVNPEGMIAADTDGDLRDEIVVDFGALGLWLWDDGVWAQLSGVNAEGMVRADADGDGLDDVVGDFGAVGLWLWGEGSWAQLSGINAEGMSAANTDLDPADEVAADFGTVGLWIWNGGVWTQLSGANAEGMIAAGLNPDLDEELVLDFGAIGLWMWDDGVWTQVSGANAEGMAAGDLDGDSEDDLAVDFASLGLWFWNSGTWSQVSSVNAEFLLSANATSSASAELIVDFGPLGIWLWDGGTWSQISTANPGGMIAANLDTDAERETVADFGSAGMWVYNAGVWSQLAASDPDSMIARKTGVSP